MSDKDRAIDYLQNLINMANSGEVELLEFRLEPEDLASKFYDGYIPAPPNYFTLSILYKDNRK